MSCTVAYNLFLHLAISSYYKIINCILFLVQPPRFKEIRNLGRESAFGGAKDKSLEKVTHTFVAVIRLMEYHPAVFFHIEIVSTIIQTFSMTKNIMRQDSLVRCNLLCQSICYMRQNSVLRYAYILINC